MATTKQKQAARRNMAKAREVQSQRARGKRDLHRSEAISTAAENRLRESEFAFYDTPSRRVAVR
jgi:hypothetical protein